MERIRNAYEYSNYKPVEQTREVKKKNWSSVGEQKLDVCKTVYKLSDLQIILMT